MTNQQHIRDEGGLLKYFAAIPHMADEDLDLFEYRLYGHYKHCCGEYNKPCDETVRQTAQATGISHPKVIAARQSLANKGYIRTEQAHQRAPVIVTLVDLWPQNIARFSKRAQSVQLVSQSTPSDQPVAQPVQNISQAVQPIEQTEHENSPKKEEDKNQQQDSGNSRRPRDEMFDALVEVCRLNPKLSGSYVARTKKELVAMGKTPEDVKAFGVWWYVHDWRGQKNQAPTLNQVATMIEQPAIQPALPAHPDKRRADPDYDAKLAAWRAKQAQPPSQETDHADSETR